jgi:hypothetical protein
MKSIRIDIIDPPYELRYDTSGDYFMEGDTLVFQVRRQDNDFLTKMQIIHELIEQTLCEEKGISNQAIDDFDMMDKEWIAKYEEPGDDPRAPYHDAHILAKTCEYIILGELGINFKEYFKQLR